VPVAESVVARAGEEEVVVAESVAAVAEKDQDYHR
jgi:hypothetical protein